MDSWHIIRLFAIRLAVSAAFLWAVFHYLGMIPFIIGIPFAGVMLAKPVIEAGATWFHWARKQPYAEWHGKYYEFAGRQVRLIEVGPELWVVDADLLGVIGEKPSVMLESLYDVHEYDEIPGTGWRGFSPDGVEKVLRGSAHHEAGRMLLWLQREVYRQHARKRELAAGRRQA